MISKVNVKKQLHGTTRQEDELIDLWDSWGWESDKIVRSIKTRRDDIKLSWQRETFNNLYTGQKYKIKGELK